MTWFNLGMTGNVKKTGGVGTLALLFTTGRYYMQVGVITLGKDNYAAGRILNVYTYYVSYKPVLELIKDRTIDNEYIRITEWVEGKIMIPPYSYFRIEIANAAVDEKITLEMSFRVSGYNVPDVLDLTGQTETVSSTIAGFYE